MPGVLTSSPLQVLFYRNNGLKEFENIIFLVIWRGVLLIAVLRTGSGDKEAKELDSHFVVVSFMCSICCLLTENRPE